MINPTQRITAWGLVVIVSCLAWYSVNGQSDLNLCPMDWVYVKSAFKCLHFDRSLRGNFSDNEAHCKQLEGSMVIINSQEESDEINQLLGNKVISRYWLGGQVITNRSGLNGSEAQPMEDSSASLTVDWREKRSGNYSGWAENEPDCRLNETCCITAGSRSRWTDVNCSVNRFMVCQKFSILGPLSEIMAPLLKMTEDKASEPHPEWELKSVAITLKTDQSPANNQTNLNVTMDNKTKSIDVNVTTPIFINGTETVQRVKHVLKQVQRNQFDAIRLWFTFIQRNQSSSVDGSEGNTGNDSDSSDLRSEIIIFKVTDFTISILVGTAILTTILLLTAILVLKRHLCFPKPERPLLISSQLSTRYLDLCYD